MDHPSRRWAALVAMCLGMALLYMNTTMVTQALPIFSKDLGATSTQLEWLISAYNLAFLSVLLLGGALGDRLGHRRVLLAGAVLFGVSAVAGTLASGPAELIAARVGMGLGASVFTPMSLALLPQLFDAHARVLATSIWTISGALGAPLGPLAGGALIDVFGWRGIFVLDAAVCLIVLLACWGLVPGSEPQGGSVRVPVLQVVTSAVAFCLVTWGLVSASQGWGRIQAWVPLCVGMVVLVVFIIEERCRTFTLTDLSLLTHRRYRQAATCLGLMNLILFGILYITPDYFQTVLGNNATVSGLLLMPMVVTALIGSISTSRIARVNRLKPYLLPASLLLVASGCATSAAARTESARAMVAGLLLAGSGMGVGQSFAFADAMEEVPTASKASGAALLNSIRQLGALLGTALVGSLVSTIYAARTPRTATTMDAHAYVTAMAWVLAGCAAVSAIIGLVQILDAVRAKK